MLRMEIPMRVRESTLEELRTQQSLDLTKYLSCLCRTNGNSSAAAEVFVKRFPDSYGATGMKKLIESGGLDLLQKAIVAPGTTTDAVWAKPLVNIDQWAGGFLAIAHGQSVLGQIPGAVQIPFSVHVPYQTGDCNYAWVSEMSPTPTSKLAFSDGLTLSPTKALGIVVLTEDFVLLANSGTTTALRNTLMGGLNGFLNKSLLDPASVAIPQQRPGSITSTAGAPIAGTGDLLKDIGTLLDAFYAARPDAAQAVLLMAPGKKSQVTRSTTTFWEPIIATSAALTNIIAVDPSALFFADGGMEISYSREAMLEMADPATSPPTNLTVLTSLFQQNLAGFRVRRFLSWATAPNAVKYLTTV